MQDMNHTQQKIADYLSGKQAPSEHDLRCFVGMIETGEATYADFIAVGGEELAKAVGEKRSAITRRVWRMGQENINE